MLLRFLVGLLMVFVAFTNRPAIGMTQESGSGQQGVDRERVEGADPLRRSVELEGWTLHVSEALYEQDATALDVALELLAQQLREIRRVVPESAVNELQKVPLWISDEYPNTPPRAEYHPDAGWLEDNDRDPEMAKGIEFTNIKIFAAETRRMPNFVLHELAHAFHDRVLSDGFGNQSLRDAFEEAKASGRYDAVEQRFGDGRSATTRSYAMSNPQEYFAESTEAYFSTNDFFPFAIEQLRQHDPTMTALVAELWGVQESTVESLLDLQQVWKHSGSLWINTTSQGANLPEGQEVKDFPLCVRLYGDSFDFSDCQSHGEDLRFSDPESDVVLKHEIETWDAERGNATVWVRVPIIRGNERREIKVHWGNLEARSASKGNQVFSASNDFMTVWHFAEALADATGALEVEDRGTVAVEGTIGLGRAFSPGQGMTMGSNIVRLPIEASPHTTETWVWIDRPNTTVVAWGNENGQGKVVMQYRSPSRINMDCYFSGGNIDTDREVSMGEWHHLAYTYSPEATRIYVDGQLAGESLEARPLLAIESPARFYVGGWYDRYDFVGKLDELRVSSTARDATWIRLQYENQKQHSTLCGTVVRSDELAADSGPTVKPNRLDLDEGDSGIVSAEAEGAEKLYWVLDRNGKQEVILTDRLSCSIDAGRVLKDENAELRLKAVYADGVREVAIPVAIRDRLPEPNVGGIRVEGIATPETWDGRQELSLVPEISNRQALSEAAADELVCTWSVSGVAVDSRIDGERLILTRSLGDGELQIEVAVSNGGPAVRAATTLRIEQPPREEEVWLDRPVLGEERPRDGQFIPRDGWGNESDRTGTLVYRGSLKREFDKREYPDRILLRAFDGEGMIAEESMVPSSDGDYEVSVKLPAALRKYHCRLIAVQGSEETILHQASDLICGDVYLIIGQSNAVATDFGQGAEPATSPWVRTFGATDTGEQGARQEKWGDARARAAGGALEIGYWGLELGKALVEQEQIPICIINGAVGGTRIDQHQRNSSDPTDVQTIYGRLLWRVRQAGLTHGVRGIFWHQGENDQGADGPTNRFGYETYESYFVALAASWKEDYPNVEHLFAFQIWPAACAMGFEGSDNRLRDVQRRLPRLFSNLSIMSTLGTQPPGGCHYPAEGYAQFAKLMLPLVRQKIYGREPSETFTPPNLRAARWVGKQRDALELEFDSEIQWNEACLDQFYLEGQRLEVSSGSVNGKRLILQLATPAAKPSDYPLKLTYLDSKVWSQDRLLIGINGVAALTFCDVPIQERDDVNGL